MSFTTCNEDNIIRIEFKNQLVQPEIYRIVEAGIKFFLFQRNQIPLPYEKLQKRDGDNPEDHVIPALRGLTLTDTNQSLDSEIQIETDGGVGWNRIQLTKQRIRTQRQEFRLALKFNRMIQTERGITTIWDDFFLKLQSLISSALCTLQAIAVVFGPSVFNPKESIIFRVGSLVTMCVEGQPTPVSNEATAKAMQARLRDFHKKIIMSNEYLDFTTKPLKRTNTFLLCAFHKEQKQDFQELHKNWMLLESFSHTTLAQCISMSSQLKDEDFIVPARKVKNKCLDIRLELGGSTVINDAEGKRNPEDLLFYQLGCRYRCPSWK